MSGNKHQRAASPAPIMTWRERIGVPADYPLHAPTDVERAMEAEIAELRAQGETAEAYRLLNGVLNQFRSALAPYHFDIDEAAIAKIGELARAHVASRGASSGEGK
jgi:Asp-tRNA(Asn)/Glu-tRNA(Gln) amidotransferase A subunit family amidase